MNPDINIKVKRDRAASLAVCAKALSADVIINNDINAQNIFFILDSVYQNLGWEICKNNR